MNEYDAMREGREGGDRSAFLLSQQTATV
jgi:hypothetical protein